MKKDKEKKPKEKVKQPPLKERLRLYTCPTLLGGAICFSIIYALYRPLSIPYTAMFMLLEIALFMLFDRIKNIKFLGGLIYTLMLFAVLFLSMNMTFSGAALTGDYGAPMSWFYGESGSYDYQPLFLNAVFLGGGFFIISILYYFSQIRYRSIGALLCTMFPFVIYAKRADAMPDLMVTVIVTLYLAVVVHNRRVDPAQPKEMQGRLLIDRSYIISALIFVSVTATITMVIKKPTYFSKLERDSNYFDYVQTDATGSGSLEGTSQTSSQRYGGDSYNNRPLFYFETDGKNAEYYLRRQSYDDFNGSVWEVNTKRSESYGTLYTSLNPEYATDDVLIDMQEIYSKYGSTDYDPAKLITRRRGRVYSETFSPVYLPAPLNTITDDSDIVGIEYRKYQQGVIIRSSSFTEETTPVVNDSFDYYDQTEDLYYYAWKLGLSGEEYEDTLYDLAYYYDSEAAQRLLDDYYDAQERFTGQENISDEVRALAEEITADCDSDIEKAYALERYFEASGYIYDTEYVPDDQSIDYFIFEGKRGVCSSYATAMTLMARSIGLPARYVEGFAAFEKTDSTTFLIRDSYAHAFVEVYIPGAGWLTFDPTVSDYLQIPEDNSGFDAGVFLRILSRFLVVIIVAFVVIFVLLLDRIMELIFRIRQHFRTPAERTLKLYANLIKLVTFSTREDHSAYTVKMLREHLYKTRGVAPEKILALFERVCFGGYIPTMEEYNEAYREYKLYYKYLRKIPRKKPEKVPQT